jgi:hypothetical protein
MPEHFEYLFLDQNNNRGVIRGMSRLDNKVRGLDRGAQNGKELRKEGIRKRKWLWLCSVKKERHPGLGNAKQVGTNHTWDHMVTVRIG